MADKTKQLLKAMKTASPKVVPIATDMVLPNLSGIGDHPEAIKNFILPAGCIIQWGGNKDAPPTGWFLCNGGTKSRTTYAGLFAVIGTTYGVGDGTTTFNLPQFDGIFPVGAGETYAVGETGGENTHVLTIAELASHDHGVGNAAVAGTQSSGFVFDKLISPSLNRKTTLTGSGNAHENRPPFLSVAFIIKY